jgi:hypothetical protein
LKSAVARDSSTFTPAGSHLEQRHDALAPQAAAGAAAVIS